MDHPATPPRRRTHHLAIGRRSVPGATYFVTACTHLRRAGLTEPNVARTILDALVSEVGSDFLHLATVMPDHVHALFALSDRLSLSDTLIQFKQATSPALADSAPDLKWQRNFFDRRVRTHESLESYALYVFLNPYRAGLLPLHAHWPWTVIGTAVRFRFHDAIERENTVRPEWLGASDQWEKALSFTLGDR